METIYKYRIEITDRQLIRLPVGRKIIHAGPDPMGTPCLWAIIDTEDPAFPEELFIVGTGNPMPPLASEHIGSFVQGQFVWHAFLSIFEPDAPFAER